jgi:hypothetical protein
VAVKEDRNRDKSLDRSAEGLKAAAVEENCETVKTRAGLCNPPRGHGFLAGGKIPTRTRTGWATRDSLLVPRGMALAYHIQLARGYVKIL